MARPKKTPFTTREPRTQTATMAKCFGDPSLFLPTDDLQPSAIAEFQINGPIPCFRDGVPGVWCATCRFGVVADPIEIEGV